MKFRLHLSAHYYPTPQLFLLNRYKLSLLVAILIYFV